MTNGRCFFVSSLYPQERLREIELSSKGVLQNAANALQWSFVKGFNDYFKSLVVITLPAIGTFPTGYSKLFFKGSIFNLKNFDRNLSLPFVTLPVIGLISRYFSLKKALSKESFTKDDILFVYSLHSPFLLSTCQMRKKNNFHLCVIVPDLPEYMSESKNVLYRLFKWIDKKVINRCLAKADSFVLLTDYMADFLKLKQPWVRIEGIYAENDKVVIGKSEEFVFMYAGTLDTRYGIIELIEEFVKENLNAKLWICGKGAAEKYIIQKVKQDSRIEYFGQLSREDVLKMQKSATVLVNPRLPSSGEYVKYSFPSKTMEYLASGTPCIMYKLPTIPNEYDPYIFYADEKEGLGKKMSEVYSICKDDLNKKGLDARIFMLECKNPQKQVMKIVKMIKNNS